VIDDIQYATRAREGRGVYARRAFASGEFVFRRRHTKILTAAIRASRHSSTARDGADRGAFPSARCRVLERAFCAGDGHTG
jgi:hypothetical protein